MESTLEIRVSGRVQGVGFRPYVFRLANNHELKGFVTNNKEGVFIAVSGSTEKTKYFLEELKQSPPPSALIQSVSFEKVDFRSFDDFAIVPSVKNTQIDLPLTPDFGICDQCKKELTDAKNRRLNYPFITCVNCGPRYALTNKFPFEREHTSVADFEMCIACHEEYQNPSDRRFHSQTNSCSSCGVTLSLQDKNGYKEEIEEARVVAKVAVLIRQGKIIAIKNTSGYLLCCDASNEQAIKNLRARKHRPQKPFAVMYQNMEMLEQDFPIPEACVNEVKSSVSPIVILDAREHRGTIVLNAVAPHLNQIGVMLPYSGLMYLILKKLNCPIVATSGNISGSAILSREREAHEQLSGVADYFLNHNLDIVNPQDDSVVKFSFNSSQKVTLRRSRGLAPNYLNYSSASNQTKVLAMGSQLKSTFSIIPNSHLYVSQYFGNLESYDVYKRYSQTIYDHLAFFDTNPEVILVDGHKGYQSTELGEDLALKFQAKVHSIQHHKAHFASVLGEHNLFGSKEKILGVIWDGTGLGDDGMIWGGEFFTYENNSIHRLTHFDYFDSFIGDKMAMEPRISLLSLCSSKMNDQIKPKFTEVEWEIYQKKQETNTLKTSSVGRLFDSVASLLGLIDVNTYEGEAAMLLENCIDEINPDCLRNYLENDTVEPIPSKLIIERIYQEKNEGIPNSQLAANFIFTLAHVIILIAKRHNFKTIAMSGGVFQNTTLIEMILSQSNSEFVCKFNTALSPNDESISFGQMMYYQNIK